MLSRITALLALVLAAGLIAAGCGGDDDETTTAATTTPTTTTGATGATGPTGAGTGEPLSKEEFISEADAICKAGDEEIDAAADETFSGGEPSQAEQEEFVTGTVIPSVQEQVDGIAALTPPEGDEQEVQAIIDAAQDGLDDLESDPAAFVGGGSNPLAEANELAKDYGLKVCGQG